MGTSANRRTAVVVLGSLALLVLLILLAENSFNLKFLSPQSTSSILFFTALSGLSFLLFLTLLVLLLRNILKLYASGQSRVLGSRLRTRMLLGALLLSLAPAIFMLFFNYLLMNRSIDRWFSQPVVQLRDDSMRIALEMAQYASANARAEAESIAAEPDLAASVLVTPISPQVFQRHRVTLQGGFVLIFRGDALLDSYQVPAANVPIRIISGLRAVDQPEDWQGQSLVQMVLRAAGRADDPVLHVGDMAYALGRAMAPGGRIVVVGMPLSVDVASAMAQIEGGTHRYWGLIRARRHVRQTYFLVLLLLTGLTLFVSSWLALFVSKQVTRPVEALADAMDAMASGNYSTRVDVETGGELGELVHSFNHMATDLETSRMRLEESTDQLSAANLSLDERRRELETVLETIPSGVATLDRDLHIVRVNRAFQDMFDPSGERALEGAALQSLFPVEAAAEITRVLRRSRRLPSASIELETSSAGGPLHLMFTAAELRGSLPGYLVVLDNVTDVLRAQKQLAWKEVAQRVAHEIKNPLTPIALSAERIERHLDRGMLAGSAESLRSATGIIRSSVETLRRLVDQFAALADFPASRPESTDLNRVVTAALALFEGRLEGIEIFLDLAPDLPSAMADASGMQRAISNLIDNAAEAMQQSLIKRLTVTTGLGASHKMAEIVIADTGHGISDETRERLFLPFFSTRRRGTGLGLSIAAKIIQEHQGTVRVEKNSPAGTRFIIELPLAESAVLRPEETGSAAAR